MISADIKTDVKQEIKKLVAASYNFSQACIFHLILVGIPCSLILSIKNREGKGGGWRCLLNSQNLLRMTKDKSYLSRIP